MTSSNGSQAATPATIAKSGSRSPPRRAALPAEQRSVFALHHLEGFSYAEVAAILRIPEPTVRGRLARGRRTLLNQLKD